MLENNIAPIKCLDWKHFICIEIKKENEKGAKPKKKIKINQSNLHYGHLVCFNSIFSIAFSFVIIMKNAKEEKPINKFCCQLNEANGDFVLIGELLIDFKWIFETTRRNCL